MAYNQGWQEVKVYNEDWQVTVHDQRLQDQMEYDAGRQEVMAVYDQQSWQVMFYGWGSQEASVFD